MGGENLKGIGDTTTNSTNDDSDNEMEGGVLIGEIMADA